jgi:hypothetical protein
LQIAESTDVQTHKTTKRRAKDDRDANQSRHHFFVCVCTSSDLPDLRQQDLHELTDPVDWKFGLYHETNHFSTKLFVLTLNNPRKTEKDNLPDVLSAVVKLVANIHPHLKLQLLARSQELENALEEIRTKEHATNHQSLKGQL